MKTLIQFNLPLFGFTTHSRHLCYKGFRLRRPVGILDDFFYLGLKLLDFSLNETLVFLGRTFLACPHENTR